jgi:hypothetical protein
MSPREIGRWTIPEIYRTVVYLNGQAAAEDQGPKAAPIRTPEQRASLAKLLRRALSPTPAELVSMLTAQQLASAATPGVAQEVPRG